jgi:hypothetical protein
VAPGPQGLARIAALATAPLDWDAAVHLGLRHGLAPLMHLHLSAAHVPLPRRIAATLWARAQSVDHRNRAMREELVAIATALGERGVRFAPFKGPLLAAAVRCAATRESGDLDILVATGDVPAARAVLAARGYAPRTPLDPVREKLWLESPGLYEFPLEDAARGFVVELQWRANPEVAVPALDARWWEAAPLVRFGGVEMRSLPDHEQILALLVHGAKHHWGSLDWLVDVAELARGGRIPWDELMGLAKRHGAMRRAALGLELAHRLVEAPLPPQAAAFIASARIMEIARRLIPPLLATEYVPPPMGPALRIELALCDTTPQRIARLAHLLRPTPGDWEWCRLPRRWTFAYWALRPVRLAAKYLFSLRSPRTPPAATPRTPPPQPHSTG